MALWHDRRGRFSPLRAATLVLLVAPFLALIYFTLTHQLGARPRTEAIHEMGLWGIRFLMLSLFVTPMRRIARYAQLVDVRRMIGVAVFCYMVLHLVLYMYDQVFDMAKVVSEIVLRYYLTIGFTAWVGLGVLAATSNNYMVRELGGIRWRHLHQLVYPITVLGTIHYFLQSKLEVFEPTVIAGIFAWLMLYRAMHWLFPRQNEFPLWVIAVSWLAIGALTFLTEAIVFSLAFPNATIWRVLVLDFSFRAGIRPGWYVWGVGALVTLIGVVRQGPLSGWLAFASGNARRAAS